MRPRCCQALYLVVVAGRGAEESTAWRHPNDLIALCQEGAGELAGLFSGKQRGGSWSGHAVLPQALLGGDPLTLVRSIKAAVFSGAVAADPRPAPAFSTAPP